MPEDEFNDGVIVAEVALAEIPMLATSDHHLLDILPAAVQVELGAADLSPIAVAIHHDSYALSLSDRLLFPLMPSAAFPLL